MTLVGSINFDYANLSASDHSSYKEELSTFPYRLDLQNFSFRFDYVNIDIYPYILNEKAYNSEKLTIYEEIRLKAAKYKFNFLYEEF